MNYLNRLERLKKHLPELKNTVLVIDEVTDLFYLTGLILSLGRLVITSTKSVLFVDGRYFEACQRQSPIEVHLTQGYGKGSAFADFLLDTSGSVLFDATKTSYQGALDLQALLGANREVVGVKCPILTLRQIKESAEIALLKHAAQLAADGYRHLLSLLQVGVTERELVKALKIFWLEKGGEGEAFEPIIAFGEGSAEPHYKSGPRSLKKGDTVLIDIGVVLNQYHSDMTRVVFFGEPDDELKKIYSIVLKAQEAALALCKPGVLVKELDAAARNTIADAGYGHLFSHGLGHGIGLETHEWPIVKDKSPCAAAPLVEGMALTIEPGVYLPKLGGVRIEDTVVITREGHENLTPVSKRLNVL